MARMQLNLEHDEHRLTATCAGDPGDVPLDVCRELVSAIRARKPRAVHVLGDFPSPGDAWAEALDGVTLDSVKAFVFDTYFQTQTRQRDNSAGDLRATLVACPNLENLFATGAST